MIHFDKRLMTKLLIEIDQEEITNKPKALEQVVNEYCEITKTDIEEFYDIGLGDEVDDLIETLRDLEILRDL